MKLKILGCYGGELLGYKSTAFLIDDHLLIDAGNVSILTSTDDLSRIRHLVLSHAHLDHIKALPFVAEQLAEEGTGLDVYGTDEVIDSLKSHIFNGITWPDLSKLPTVQNPAVRYKRIQAESPVNISGLSVRAVPVNHTIPAAGFVVGDERSSILYSGDTGPTERLWKAANNTENLKALMIEVSYPNRLKERAIITKHLTPQLLVEEFKKIDIKGDMLIFIYHLKPLFVDEIKREICGLKINNLILLEEGDEFEV